MCSIHLACNKVGIIALAAFGLLVLTQTANSQSMTSMVVVKDLSGGLANSQASPAGFISRALFPGSLWQRKRW